ncbi:MAG: amino acid ABC transporter permease, partial [Thermodesulfobacteriota bacterium]
MNEEKKTSQDITPVVIAVGDGAAIPSRGDRGLVSAWKLSFFFAVATLAYLLIVRPTPYWRLFKFLPDGILVTFQVT